MAEPSQNDDASSQLQQDDEMSLHDLSPNDSISDWLYHLPETYDPINDDPIADTNRRPTMVPPATPTKRGEASELTPARISSTSKRTDQPDYRAENLPRNNMVMLNRLLAVPPAISRLTSSILEAKGIDICPEDPELRQLCKLQTHGATETQVQSCLQPLLFPKTSDESLLWYNQGTFRSTFVPRVLSTAYEITTPIPDTTYGYDTDFMMGAFTKAQREAGDRISPPLGKICADASFPFLVVEYKAEGSSNGNLWTATNQVMGGASTCVSIMENLNKVLPLSNKQNHAVFGMTSSQSWARLFVTWWDETTENFVTQRLASFALEEEEQLARLKGRLQAIFDWGLGTRLEGIRSGLDLISKEAGEKGPITHKRQRKSLG